MLDGRLIFSRASRVISVSACPHTERMLRSISLCATKVCGLRSTSMRISFAISLVLASWATREVLHFSHVTRSSATRIFALHVLKIHVLYLARSLTPPISTSLSQPCLPVLYCFSGCSWNLLCDLLLHVFLSAKWRMRSMSHVRPHPSRKYPWHQRRYTSPVCIAHYWELAPLAQWPHVQSLQLTATSVSGKVVIAAEKYYHTRG